jgi:hypothetical protein
LSFLFEPESLFFGVDFVKKSSDWRANREDMFW